MNGGFCILNTKTPSQNDPVALCGIGFPERIRLDSPIIFVGFHVGFYVYNLGIDYL